VHWTKWSRRCAWSPNHEFVSSGCRHQTMSFVWTAQTSCAQYIAAIYPSGCMAVWNPSKPPCHSNLVDRYLAYFLAFLCHTKNHAIYAIYFHSNKLDFKIYSYKTKIVLFSMLPSCRLILPHPSCNIIMRAIPLEFVLCINNLFKIK